MAVANPTRRAYPEEQWEAMKAYIEQKYIHESLTLEQTMQAIKDEHDFQATEKMYKTRFKKWNWSKYIKDDKALAVLTNTGDNLHRAHTVHGKPITKEEAERHLKRKKHANTWSSNQGQMDVDDLSPAHSLVALSQNVVPGSDYMTSPVTEQPNFNYGTVWPETTPEWSEIDSFDRRGTLQNGIYSPQIPAQEYDDIEMDMDITDMAVGTTQQLFQQDERVYPRILDSSGLQWTTQNFLFSMRDFATMTSQSVPRTGPSSLRINRFNKLWDLFCTQSSHLEGNSVETALVVRRQAQTTFESMLTSKDPWLLLSMCLMLNDYLSNPDRIAMSSDFLNEMANWAENVAPNHPISKLVRFLQASDDGKGPTALALLDGTIRMTLDHLRELLGVHHDLSLEIARLHSRILTSAKMHFSAIQLLSEDLAVFEAHDPTSLQNLLRRSSLARCHFMADEFSKSLDIYLTILQDPLLNEPFLADIKYGALFFVAKSYAQLMDFDEAISHANEALIFSLQQRGPGHYWATNAKTLIKEIQGANTPSMGDVFGQKIRDGFQMNTWSAHSTSNA